MFGVLLARFCGFNYSFNRSRPEKITLATTFQIVHFSTATALQNLLLDFLKIEIKKQEL